MAKIHWSRILDNPIATQLLWAELGHEDPTLLDEVCSISGPLAKNTLISFNYEDGQGNQACCGIEKLAGKFLFFGEYCAYEDDAGPFDDFEDAFGRRATGSGRTHNFPEPKTVTFRSVLVQRSKGTA